MLLTLMTLRGRAKNTYGNRENHLVVWSGTVGVIKEKREGNNRQGVNVDGEDESLSSLTHLRCPNKLNYLGPQINSICSMYLKVGITLI